MSEQQEQDLNKEPKQKTCRELVRKELRERIKDIRKLWKMYCEGDERGDPDLGTFPEYGLCFDYVAPHTFDKQPRGYFRYQLSWGGPSDEFRFYADQDFTPYKIEYWYLNWWDGAKVILGGKDLELMEEIWEFFKEVGSVEYEYEKYKFDENSS
jgi:hypothetical protein